MKKNKKKIIMAMSGGVDSSVAAALLKRKGFEVIGVFMKFWSPERKNSNTCCSPESETRARKIAKKLNIPFYVADFEEEFKKKVVDYFLLENKRGRTPNPCVICNKEIKFKLLLEKALQFNADFIATGHYAKIKKKKNIFFLKKGKDKKKDQSYFLWMLNQKQLSKVLLPIGDYKKEKVKKMAKKFDLPLKGIPESQEICFVQTNIKEFLKRHLQLKPGKIITESGEIIGKHEGLALYTIGQRKGIGKEGGPFYVLSKKGNDLIVTKKEKKLFKKKLTLEKVNWVSGTPRKFPQKLNVKIRYRHKPSRAFLSKENKKYHLKFQKAQRAITPGQSAVFYKGKKVMGGGIIS